MTGLGGGPAGDALITVTVRPHPVFRRDGNDIKSVLPVTLNEALSGGSVPVDTVTGTYTSKSPSIPAAAASCACAAGACREK